MGSLKYHAVAIGGTFDIIHSGHRQLIDRAFSTGESVMIGLTSDDFVARSGKKIQNDFQTRRFQLESYLNNKYPSRRYTIAKLEDRFGADIFTNAIDAIVVSTETLPVVEQANSKRRSIGLPDLKIEIVQVEMAEDGRRISSTRVRSGEIDVEGHLRN